MLNNVKQVNALLKQASTLNSLPADFANQYEAGKNKYNNADTDILLDQAIDSNGAIVASANIFTSGFIPVVPGKIFFSMNGATAPYCQVYAYDANKAFVSLTGSWLRSYVVPSSGVAFIRFSADKVNKNNYQVEYDRITAYEVYKQVIKSSMLANTSKIDPVLPASIYAICSKDWNIFGNNIVKNREIGAFAGISTNAADVFYIHPKFLKFRTDAGTVNGVSNVNTTKANSATEIYACEKFLKTQPTELDQEDVKRIVIIRRDLATAGSSLTKHAVFIGDSHTANGKYTSRIAAVLNGSSELKLNMIGTLNGGVTASAYTEGRAGWCAQDYTTLSTKSSVTNAFWNSAANSGAGGFDFAYWVNNAKIKGTSPANKNLLYLNDPDFVDGKQFSPTGEPTTDSPSLSCTGYIPVSEGQVLKFSNNGVSDLCVGMVCTYGSDKTFIARAIGNVSEFTVPSGATFVKLAISTSKKATIQVELNAVTSYVAYKPKLDFVYINLGTNDATLTTIDQMITAYKAMLDSIKAYNATIRVFLWLPPPPSTHDFRAGLKNKILDVCKALVENFDGKESAAAQKIVLVPVYVNVNTEEDFDSTSTKISTNGTATFNFCTDPIHLNQVGNNNMADMLIMATKYWAANG